MPEHVVVRRFAKNCAKQATARQGKQAENAFGAVKLAKKFLGLLDEGHFLHVSCDPSLSLIPRPGQLGRTVTVPCHGGCSRELDIVKVRSEALLDVFVDPIVVRHPTGHIVPGLDERSLETVLGYIEFIEKNMAETSSL